MVSLIPSNKGGDTNFLTEYGNISCWLVFYSSAYLEEKCGTSEVTAWYLGDSRKISTFTLVLNCYSQRNNKKPVLIDIIA